MRARLFFCYLTWERAMFSKESKKSLQKLIKLRVDLLANATPSPGSSFD
jgi:hypothetical protein